MMKHQNTHTVETQPQHFTWVTHDGRPEKATKGAEKDPRIRRSTVGTLRLVSHIAELSMAVEHRTLSINTGRRGAIDITAEVAAAVRSIGVDDGLAHLFLQHTSASLIIQENADPSVLHDLEEWLVRHIPDGDPRYRHSQEGPDDMSAHLRTMLTATSLTLPVQGGRLALGTWQGIYLYEHRTHSHSRRVVVSLLS